MAGCYCSPDAFGYNDGLKGENAELTKILFVMHRSDSRALPDDWESASDEELSESYMEKLRKSQTGRVLEWLFEHCDIGYEDVYLTNAYKCLLPDDRNPRKQEYIDCLSHLERQVQEEFSPERIVVFGSKTYEIMFPEQSKSQSYAEAVGNTLEYRGVPALICWHPQWLWSHPKHQRKEHYQAIKDFLNASLKPSL